MFSALFSPFSSSVALLCNSKKTLTELKTPNFRLNLKSLNEFIKIDKRVRRVTQVNLKTTKAITNDDKILVIANHKFLNEILYNWTQNNGVTREFVDIGVAYGTDVDLVKTLLLRIAVQKDAILNKPKPMVFFEDFRDSALKFRLHFYINDSFICH